MLLNNFSLLFSDRLNLKVIPSLDFDQHFDFLCEKVRLQQNSKIRSEHFRSVFYALLYVRMFPKNEIGSNILAMFTHLYIPYGFQKSISFIPLRGQLYNIKGTSLSFDLHNEVTDYIEMNYKNGNLLSNLSYLSRELSTNKNALKVRFDERLMLGTSQGFILNSFMSYEETIPKLGAVPQKMYVSHATPEVNVSLAISLLFGLHCEEQTAHSFIGLAGCIGKVEFNEQSFLHNVRLSIELLFKGDGKGKSIDNNESTERVNPGKLDADKSVSLPGPPYSGSTYTEGNVRIDSSIVERLAKLEGSFTRLEDVIKKDISSRNLSFYPEMA
jgi:hypothetical protein